MTPERYQKAGHLYHAALEIEPEARAAFLDGACGEDKELRREAESLLRAHDKVGNYFAAPALEIAAGLLTRQQNLSLAGRSVSHYRVHSLIGAGGMGEVYLAEDTALNRKVAIKFLPTDTMAEPQAKKRLIREAQAAATLDHPNIWAIYEVGEEDGRSFIVMQYVEGKTLADFIGKKPLALPESLDIAAQIADALSEAHSHQIIHRDIKPQNVMITLRGHAKVLDFGLARVIRERDQSESETDTQSLLTGPGAVVGTVPYMSPEQLKGDTVDGRSDIFSFGCLLYEMLSGHQPFAAAGAAATISAILTGEPPPLTRFSSDIPTKLQTIVRKCLKKDREKRFQSARELFDDLIQLKREIEAGTGKTKRLGTARRGQAFDSIAVLPFSIAPGNQDAEYLGDGITESIINSLAQMPGLKVMARSTVFRYKDQNKDPLQIGRELHVKTVLAGRVFQRGDMLMIGAELIDVASGSQLWGQQYKRRFGDIFEIQDEISIEISEKLRLRLTREQQRKLTRHYTNNPDAYQLYLKGRYCWNQRTLDGMRKAVEFFLAAIKRDPGYARAYTGLGDCYAMLGIYSGLAPRDSFPKAKVAETKALEIEEDLADARASLGFAHLYYDWDPQSAKKELEQAIRLNPGYASAHQWHAMYLMTQRRTEEAIEEMKVAQRLDPFSVSINVSAVYAIYFARRYEEAIEQYRMAVDIHPNYWGTHYWLGLAYAQTAEFPLAIAELERARDLGDTPWRLSGLGHVYAMAGRREEAENVARELEELSQQTYVSPYDIAVVYAGLGRAEQSFEWLERAYEDRTWRMMWLAIDPQFDSVRSDHRFAELLRRVGLH